LVNTATNIPKTIPEQTLRPEPTVAPTVIPTVTPEVLSSDKVISSSKPRSKVLISIYNNTFNFINCGWNIATIFMVDAFLFQRENCKD
jgi:hypothetical protein